MISGNVSIKFGYKGPNLCMVTACASGTHNIGDAARIIEYGDADVMVAGGADLQASVLPEPYQLEMMTLRVRVDLGTRTVMVLF